MRHVASASRMLTTVTKGVVAAGGSGLCSVVCVVCDSLQRATSNNDEFEDTISIVTACSAFQSE